MRRFMYTIFSSQDSSMFFVLGKENFERCRLTLKGLKEMVKKSHDNFFTVTDERIYALEDLLSAFGMDDIDDDDETVVLALSPSKDINLNQVQWMKTSYGRFDPCKCILPVPKGCNQLAMLDYLVPTQHHFECEEFIQFVLKKNPVSDERVNTLLREERVTELSTWGKVFRANPTIFEHRAYLPLLSEFGNMLIQPCDIHIDRRHGPVFVAIPSQTVIDHTTGKSEPKHLFVVVRQNENHISVIFTTVTPDLNELHSKFDQLHPKDPRRAVVLLEKALSYVNEAQRLDKRNHLTGMHIKTTQQ